MSTERRTSYRMVPRDSLVEAIHLASSASARVKVLNSAGGALVSSSWTGQQLRSPALRFQLGAHGAFDAEVLLLGPAAETGSASLMAFRFQALSGDALGMLSAFLCSEHAQASKRLERTFSRRDATLAIDATTPVRELPEASAPLALLRHYLNDEQRSLFLFDERREATVPLASVRLLERDGASVLLASLPDVAVEVLNEAADHIFFCADELAVTWFRSRFVRQGPTEILIAAPDRLYQGGFRCSRRVAPPWGHPVTAVLENPHLLGESIARPVSEIAGNGFAIAVDPARDRLFPGQHLRRVRLDLPSGAVEMQCVLRMCRAGQAGRMTAGFEIVGFSSPEHHDRWMRALIPCLFPRARIGDAQVVSDAWARLERSGYLELIEGSERNRLRTPFFDDWTRQANHPGLHARLVLSYQDGTPIGITATNLIYPKTCLVHSGGIDKAAQGTGQVLDLYSAAFLFAHTMGEYCLSLFDAEKHTNAVLFEQFVKHYATPSDNVFDRFALYKWHASHGVAPTPVQPSRCYDVVSANGKLMRVLWEQQQESLSPLEIDAYGWSPDGRCMQQFSERCAADGYHRRRQLLFALRDGIPLAALVAETGSEGMNVFSLLNACNIVYLRCPADERADVARSLLMRGIDYYNGSGTEAFLFLASCADQQHARLAELGFSYVAQGWRWLAAKRVIPAYITYLRDLSALRDMEHCRREDIARLTVSTAPTAKPLSSTTQGRILPPHSFTI